MPTVDQYLRVSSRDSAKYFTPVFDASRRAVRGAKACALAAIRLEHGVFIECVNSANQYLRVRSRDSAKDFIPVSDATRRAVRGAKAK